MKKKIRMFFFISALCLMFGVIVMGVYASAEVRYGISGNISYDVPDCTVKLTCNHVTGAGKTENSLYASNETLIQETTVSNSSSTTTLPTLYFINSSPTTVFDITLKFTIDNFTVPFSLSIVATKGSAFGSSGVYKNITCKYSEDNSTYTDELTLVANPKAKKTVYVKLSASSVDVIKNLSTTGSPELFVFQITTIA